MPVRFAASVIASSLAAAVAAASPGVTAEESANAYGGLPEGEGRILVYNMCNACHSLDTVKQQHMTRARWDHTLQWMQVEQGMPELLPEDEDIVLDYLSEHFGPGKTAEGAPAPAPGGFGGFGGTTPFAPLAPPPPPPGG